MCWTENYHMCNLKVWTLAKLLNNLCKNGIYIWRKKLAKFRNTIRQVNFFFFTCAQSLRSRSLTRAWASLKTRPRPFSPAHVKALLQDKTLESDRTLPPISTKVSRAFSPPPSPPSSSLSWFYLFFSVWLLHWAEQSARTGSWVGLLFAKGGERRGGDRCEGVGLSSHGTTHCFTSTAQMTGESCLTCTKWTDS